MSKFDRIASGLELTNLIFSFGYFQISSTIHGTEIAVFF